VRIARNDADGARLGARGGGHELLVRNVMIQIQAARRRAARVRVTARARRAAGAVGRFENLSLNRRERRLEVGCWSGDGGQFFVAGRQYRAGGADEQERSDSFAHHIVLPGCRCTRPAREMPPQITTLWEMVGTTRRSALRVA